MNHTVTNWQLKYVVLGGYREEDAGTGVLAT